jgi:Mycobacterium membrane protein
MANFGTMGTTITPHLKPHLDDDLRGYPDEDAWETDETDSYPDDDYNWTGWPAELRWRPVTAVLGAVVAVGAIATAVIINSGDSASTKATVGASAPHPMTSAPATTKTSAPPSASPSPSRTPQLTPETVTTMPPPSAGPGAEPSMGPMGTPTAAPPAIAPGQAPSVALNPRTVVYSVTGTKQLLDLVNIVYTDARGYPQTEFNVSLPWSRVVVLNPGVQTESVVATSFYGQLNCSVVNAAGQLVVASTNNSSLATCTR